MIFAHDTEFALLAAADLVNSLDGDDDRLADPDSLNRYLDTWGFTGTRRGDRAELASVHELRPQLRALWTCDKDSLVVRINAMLRDAHALPQLVRHDEWDYHLHATPPDAPLATRMAVEAAMAFVDVVRGEELNRLRTCEMDDCDNVTVDLTKNKSKRYCDASCSNRAAVNAYRARQRDRSPADR